VGRRTLSAVYRNGVRLGAECFPQASRRRTRTNRALDRSAPLKAFKTVAGFREEKICFEGEEDNAKHHRKKRRLQPHHAQIVEHLEKGVRPRESQTFSERFELVSI
jgi:hypothetical protein